MTLTSDVGKILASLHRVQSKGEINFLTAVKIAHVSANEVENEIYSMDESGLQRGQWLHSSVSSSVAPVSRGQGFKPC